MRKRKFKVVALPSGYPCCFPEVACAQHQEQAEVEHVFSQNQGATYRVTVPKYTDSYLLESLDK
jgi:hypothetical protein